MLSKIPISLGSTPNINESFFDNWRFYYAYEYNQNIISGIPGNVDSGGNQNEHIMVSGCYRFQYIPYVSSLFFMISVGLEIRGEGMDISVRL